MFFGVFVDAFGCFWCKFDGSMVVFSKFSNYNHFCCFLWQTGSGVRYDMLPPTGFSQSPVKFLGEASRKEGLPHGLPVPSDSMKHININQPVS